jgi:Fe-S-cluster containining protein
VTPPARPIEVRYEDPLDRIWVTCAARVGLRITRTDDVYAATDGRGSLALATDASLDPDDGLAQLIFHELCHSLVQGPERFAVPDWGLCNQTPDDRLREHACLRLQATLARPHGLRRFLAPTTEYRAFYDALPEDALGDGVAGDAWLEVVLARRGLVRVERAPWHPHVTEALEATASVLRAVRGHADGPPVPDGRALSPGTSAAGASLPSLLARVDAPAPRHPRTRLPLAAGAAAEARCGDCAWRTVSGRCLQTARRVKVGRDDEACERFEAAGDLDCRRCGACCRAAYGAVTVRADDPVVSTAPGLLTRAPDGFVTMSRRPERGPLAEPGDTRCVALEGDLAQGVPYACGVYADRPATCREFTRGGPSCLEARRRVGLSR